jgi:hypothetical protein
MIEKVESDEQILEKYNGHTLFSSIYGSLYGLSSFSSDNEIGCKHSKKRN